MTKRGIILKEYLKNKILIKMAQLDLNGFYDLVFCTVTSTILGIIIMTLISIDSEKSFGNIR
jgi:hypothetical protein